MFASNAGASPKILLVVDDSPQSEAAVSLLTHIAWPAGTRIHVLAMGPGCLPPAGFRSTTQNALGDETKVGILQPDATAAKTLAAQVARILRTHDLTVEVEPCEGRSLQLIVERAMKLMINLIVIGAKGVAASGKFPLGSTAYRLAHFTNYSMLVARPWDHVRPLSMILAVDDSPEACRAVEFLCTLSLPNWARVTVVSVAEQNAGIAAGKQLPANASQTTRQASLNAAESCMAKVAERLHNCGAQVRQLICCGCPADQILCAAQQREAALIVIGARGQTRVDPFRLGQVTHKVVSCAPCSVLMME